MTDWVGKTLWRESAVLAVIAGAGFNLRVLRLCLVLVAGGEFFLVLFKGGCAGCILCNERWRFFRHGQRRQQQRRQSENAGHTHTAGHFKDLLAEQVLCGAIKI